MLRVLVMSDQLKGKTMSVITAFITRNIVADDPAPEYSRLDRMDFPVTGGCYHGRHPLCTNDAGVPCNCGCHR